MNLPAIVRSELTCRLRTEPPHPLFAVSVVALGAIAMAGLWWASTSSPQPGPMIGSPSFAGAASNAWRSALAPHRGSVLFFVLSLGLIGLAGAVAPVAAAATLNRERDGKGIESLLLSGVSALTIVSGKLLAAVVRTLLVLAAATPPLAAAWLFGGVSPRVVVTTAAITAAFAILGAAVAVFMSSLVRPNLAAVLYSYLALGLITAAVPGGLAIAVIGGGQAQWLPLVQLSAPIALLSASPELVGALQPLLPFALRDLAREATQTWFGLSLAYPFLVTTIMGYLAIAAVLVALSSALLDPFHPLRALPQLVFGRGLRR